MKRAAEILGENLERLMEAKPALGNLPKLKAAASRFKPMDDEISERTIGSMKSGKSNPTLANIEAVARAFEVEAWEMLIDHEQARRRLLEQLLGVPGVPDKKKDGRGFVKMGKRRDSANE